jgi:hypothetical protein
MAYVIHVGSRTEAPDRLSLVGKLNLKGFSVGEVSLASNKRKPSWCPKDHEFFVIELRGIRLMASRPYCGNHPGPCDAANPHARFNKDGSKPKSKALEAADWIKVHTAVNDWLDTMSGPSLAYTEGADCDGNKMYVRRVGQRRVRWDYVEIHHSIRPIRLWLSGKPGGGKLHDFQFSGPPCGHDFCIIEGEGDVNKWEAWESEEDAIERASS